MNVDKPLPPVPSYSRHGAARDELFLPPVQLVYQPVPDNCFIPVRILVLLTLGKGLVEPGDVAYTP